MNDHGPSAGGRQWAPRVQREVLTPEGLASRLEYRLYSPEVGEDELLRGCAYAREVGMPVVLCRPDQVQAAVRATSGSQVEVVTALGFSQGSGESPSRPRSAESYAQEAKAFVSRGVQQVGLVTGADDATPQGLNVFTGRVAAVREAVSPVGGKVRVMVRTAGMSLSELRTTCQELAQAGVWLVHGGTYLDDRAGLQEVVQMREALGPDVLLKWSSPLRSIESVMVCLAEGVDRFNGDPPALLRAARVASRYGPLTIPLKGFDY